jgi:hypothetical protein
MLIPHLHKALPVMHNNMTKFTIVILLLLNLTAKGQVATFVWSDEMCEYESKFDSCKITREQIINAYSFVGLNEYRISKTPSVYKIEDISRLNLNSLDFEYNDKKSRLLKLRLPDNDIWETFRQNQLNEIDELYRLCKLAYNAYLTDNYQDLKKFNEDDSCLQFYSAALIFGGDSLLSAWKLLTEVQASKNGSPENVWTKYNEQLNSELKMQHGKIQIMTFGWWNCAVDHIAFFTEYQNVYDEFLKLFISTKEINCEDPCGGE